MVNLKFICYKFSLRLLTSSTKSSTKELGDHPIYTIIFCKVQESYDDFKQPFPFCIKSLTHTSLSRSLVVNQI